jgi:toxin-antitoxin system PIN domain toxin
VKVPDANVLLNTINAGAAAHVACRRWVEKSLGGDEPVGLSWSVLTAFVRIATNPRIFRDPFALDEVFDIVDEMLAQPAAVLVAPGARHASILRGLLAPLGTAGNLVNDAHLAALAIELGADVVSCDSDFARFAGVSWIDPTTASPKRRP